MESLLHYVWRHKMLPLGDLHTTDGCLVEVINPGLHNRTGSGPDFFNAKIKVDGMLWVGNVEMHSKASDWYRHGHDSDGAYDSVILHVVESYDMDVTTSQGRLLPTLVIPVPESLSSDYEALLSTDKYPPCYEVIPHLSLLKVHAWTSALQTERLEQKTRSMSDRVKHMNGSWDDGYFITLARSFGFGVNGDAFESWANLLPLRAVDHHRDNLMQIEAMFVGVAGLLSHLGDGISASTTHNHAKEFEYLQKKFGLPTMDASLWSYKTRPQNHPHVRLLQLARMYYERRTSISSLLACRTVKDVGELYGIKGDKLTLLAINTAIPSVFAYGSSHDNQELCTLAFDMLDSLKAEDNNIIRMWQDCGLEVKTAGDSQALIQLKKEYCDKKECLRCRFGYEFLTGTQRNRFLSEEGCPTQPTPDPA